MGFEAANTPVVLLAFPVKRIDPLGTIQRRGILAELVVLKRNNPPTGFASPDVWCPPQSVATLAAAAGPKLGIYTGLPGRDEQNRTEELPRLRRGRAPGPLFADPHTYICVGGPVAQC
jgi:hypothetical protein